MPPIDRPRRIDSESCTSARKRKRRTPDENTAPATTRTSLKRRKSLVDGPNDDTDNMDLDSGASVHDDDEYSQSGEHVCLVFLGALDLWRIFFGNYLDFYN
jgi:hypothetical protein